MIIDDVTSRRECVSYPVTVAYPAIVLIASPLLRSLVHENDNANCNEII